MIKSIGGDELVCGMVIKQEKKELMGKIRSLLGVASTSYSLFEWRKEDIIWIKCKVKCNCGIITSEFIDSDVKLVPPYKSGITTRILSGEDAVNYLYDKVVGQILSAAGKCLK